MSSAVAVPKWGNLRFNGSATRASFEVVWDVERQRRMVVQAIAGVAASVSPRAAGRGVVVELKPRHFSETADHFLRVATPVEWPLDEVDID
jgi:hypothetical protein